MTNQEILEKVIQKALDNGWKAEIVNEKKSEFKTINAVDFAVNQKRIDLLVSIFLHMPVYFDHDFAKSIWGEERRRLTVCDEGANVYKIYISNWQYHLQQMVISKDPIQYLKENAL